MNDKQTLRFFREKIFEIVTDSLDRYAECPLICPQQHDLHTRYLLWEQVFALTTNNNIHHLF